MIESRLVDRTQRLCPKRCLYQITLVNDFSAMSMMMRSDNKSNLVVNNLLEKTAFYEVLDDDIAQIKPGNLDNTLMAEFQERSLTLGWPNDKQTSPSFVLD